MSDRTDPIRLLHASMKRRTIAGIAAICIIGIWAFWPISSHTGKSDFAARSLNPKAPEGVRWIVPGPEFTRAANLDLKPFEAQLWKVPPKPVQVAEAPPPPPPIPPPPLKLQLIAILRSSNPAASTDSDRDLQAALFDAETNKLYTVAAGAAVQRYRVKSITADTVELVDAQLPAAPVHALKMRSIDPKAGSLIRSASKNTGKPEPALPPTIETPSAGSASAARTDGGQP